MSPKKKVSTNSVRSSARPAVMARRAVSVSLDSSEKAGNKIHPKVLAVSKKMTTFAA